MSEFVVYSGVRMRGGIEDGERWDKGFVELIRYACGCDSCRFEK